MENIFGQKGMNEVKMTQLLSKRQLVGNMNMKKEKNDQGA